MEKENTHSIIDQEKFVAPETGYESQNENRPKYIRDVKLIHDVTQSDYCREDLSKLVELPLLKACQTLYDKGVPTCQSGVNNSEMATITINYQALSDENRAALEELVNEGKAHKIASSQKGYFEGSGEYLAYLTIPMKEDSTVDEVEANADEIAQRFKYQKKGPGAYTIEEMREIFAVDPDDERYTPQYLSNIYDIFYDPKSKLLYSDERVYQEALEREEKLEK